MKKFRCHQWKTHVSLLSFFFSLLVYAILDTSWQARSDCVGWSNFLSHQLSHLITVHHIHLAMATKPTQFIIYKDYDFIFSFILCCNKVTWITPIVYFLSVPLCVELRSIQLPVHWHTKYSEEHLKITCYTTTQSKLVGLNQFTEDNLWLIHINCKLWMAIKTLLYYPRGGYFDVITLQLLPFLAAKWPHGWRPKKSLLN